MAAGGQPLFVTDYAVIRRAQQLVAPDRSSAVHGHAAWN